MPLTLPLVGGDVSEWVCDAIGGVIDIASARVLVCAVVGVADAAIAIAE